MVKFGLPSLAAVFLLSGAMAQTLAPSPTESVDCEPHGDHWHCAGLRTTAESAATPSVSTTATATPSGHDHDDHDDDDDDHDHESGTASLAPSPTESVGCHPHGDHWHCDGPRVTSTVVGGNSTITSAGNGASSTRVSSTTTVVSTAGAAAFGLNKFVAVGGALAAIGLAY
ncbi:hypothetical protein GQ53DRAFT_751337 [Thozetella sp. PMI_491]|nr:hypothetical protein GQ53DRAFT_751337 [Thozetella sp. PMI_491]